MDQNEWIDICGDGGVLKRVIKKGKGNLPTKGYEVTVHYTGTLKETGKQFDSSRDRNETFNFDLGGGVIKGWNEGVSTMRPGERCILRCRSDYAYGEQGSGANIPGGATLDFDIEFISSREKWEHTWPVEHKFLEKPNDTYNLPKDEGSITFNFEVFADKERTKSLYKEENCCIELGDYEGSNKPKFLHDVLERCADGNTMFAKLEKKNHIPRIEWNVSDEIYFLSVKTLSFENVPAIWNLNLDGKRKEAIRRKEKGNNFFKLGNFSKALKQYEKSLVALEDLFKKRDPVSDNSDNGLEQDVKEKASVEDVKLFVTLQSNAGF